MDFSPMLVLVVITILSLSGAYSERYPRDYRKTNYETSLNDKPQDVFTDIGSGNYRKNVVILGPGNSQPDPLGNRFSADSTHNIKQAYPDPRQRTYTTSIGSGNHNHNIIGYEDSGSRTDAPETSDPNQVTPDGRPIQPDNNGFITQGSQPLASSSIDDQLKKLHSLSQQLQQIATQLIQEMTTNIAQQ